MEEGEEERRRGGADGKGGVISFELITKSEVLLTNGRSAHGPTAIENERAHLGVGRPRRFYHATRPESGCHLAVAKTELDTCFGKLMSRVYL